MSQGSHYTVRLYRELDAVEPLLSTLAERGRASLVFQDIKWLRLWYESFGPTGAHPMIAVATAGAGPVTADSVAMVLPLVRRTRLGLPLVEFADRSVTDYNLPIQGPRAPKTAAEAQALISALERAVRPYLLFRLTKMPREFAGHLNPLALLDGTTESPLTAHHLVLPLAADGFLRSFGKKKRTEIERAGRNLDELGPNHFAVATDPAERAAIFGMIQQAQRQRVPEKGDRYRLEDDGYREFYDRLVGDAQFAKTSIVSAIWLNGQPVAGLLGLRHGDRYVALRIGVSDSPEIMRLGLGKVLLIRTAEWAIGEGLRIFDFSLGHNALKAWFHPEPFPLVEYRSLLNGLLPARLRPARAPHDQPVAPSDPALL